MKKNRRQLLGLLSFLGIAAVTGVGLLSAEAVFAGSGEKGTVAGKITFKNASGATIEPEERAVVFLRGVPGALPDTSKMVFSVKQKDKQFAPGFIVALQGSTVEFPNEDRIDHNVFSLSSTARFDLGLYRSGKKKSVKMTRTGLIDVYCNIHPEMAGKILVLDTRFYDIANERGSFSISGLPDGTYELVAWQAYGEEQTTQVVVKDGRAAPVQLTLVQGKVRKNHTRKDGTPYGRYK